MIDVSNRVFTNVKKYSSDICNEFLSTKGKYSANFPAMSIVQIDNADAAVDLENNENAVESVIEIQSCSNKDIVEASNVINKACDAMRIMGYVRTYGPREVDNIADRNIHRMIARFRRIVSSVNDIERFE